jgi:hypothetical protein
MTSSSLDSGAPAAATNARLVTPMEGDRSRARTDAIHRGLPHRVLHHRAGNPLWWIRLGISVERIDTSKMLPMFPVCFVTHVPGRSASLARLAFSAGDFQEFAEFRDSFGIHDEI